MAPEDGLIQKDPGTAKDNEQDHDGNGNPQKSSRAEPTQTGTEAGNRIATGQRHRKPRAAKSMPSMAMNAWILKRETTHPFNAPHAAPANSADTTGMAIP